ncbi:MAG: peptidogalycan biosysnthesis protein [Chitinophagales bacterium]
MKCKSTIQDKTYQFIFPKNGELKDIQLPSSYNLYDNIDFIYTFQNIIENIRHQIVIIKEQNEVVGQLYFQCMPFKGKELATYIPQESRCFLNKTVEAIVDIALDRINWNLAVLGNVFITGDNGQAWYKNIAPSIKWKLINEAIEQYTKLENVDAVLISDIDNLHLAGSNYLVEQKFRKFEVEPDLKFYVQPGWNTFDDYLQNLTSKYRVRTNKVLEKSENITIKNLNTEDILQYENLIYKLYSNVVNQADFKLAEVPKNYFSKMKNALPNIFQVHGFFKENELIGFVCYFINTHCINVNFVGINYEYNKTYSLYQRMLYHCIEEGIKQKTGMVHFGRTATEIKTTIGALPFKSYSFIKHNSAIPNIAIKPLTTYLKPEPFTQRNPFKTVEKNSLAS